jgi:hypothetical protein
VSNELKCNEKNAKNVLKLFQKGLTKMGVSQKSLK